MRHDRYEGIPLRDLQIYDIDWTHRGEHIRSRSWRAPGDFDVEPAWATEAVMDPFRLVRTTAGLSVEVVGFSNRCGRVLKVWIVPKDMEAGAWWGASACQASRRDRREYEEAAP
ncbi:MAG: hypothetical protein WD942_05730 [Dehalococcoidia bacterium]